MVLEAIEVWRLFAMPDGTSSMEKLTVHLEGGRSSLFSGTGVQIVSMPANNTPVWHTGPRRQLIATLQGDGLLETGDGQKLVVKPGVITLIDDLTGKGHLTSNGPEGRLAVQIPINADTPVV